MSSIVYKQRYNSVKSPKATANNIGYLIYISTRKGTVYNKDCGFGLWGKLKNMDTAQNINDLDTAIERVTAMGEENKTVYKGVLSMEHTDALNKGFYDREEWQKLISNHINIITNEKRMNINSKSLEWVASYHNEKGHPHIHIMFWNNSNKVRNEFINPKKFEIMTNEIRVDFDKVVFYDELHKVTDSIEDASKKIIESNVLNGFQKALLFTEDDFKVNDIGINSSITDKTILFHNQQYFNNKLSVSKVITIDRQLSKVIISLPSNGSLKYKYLPPYVKKDMNKLIDIILSDRDSKAQLNEYLELNIERAKLYGNDDKAVEHYKDKAMQKLYTDIGNIILKNIKDKGFLKINANKTIDYVNTLIENSERKIENIECNKFEGNKEIEELESYFPNFRLQYKRFMDKSKWSLVNKITRDVLSDDVNEIQSYMLGLYFRKLLPSEFYENDKNIELKNNDDIGEVKLDIKEMDDITLEKEKIRLTEKIYKKQNLITPFNSKEEFSNWLSQVQLQIKKNSLKERDIDEEVKTINTTEISNEIKDDLERLVLIGKENFKRICTRVVNSKTNPLRKKFIDTIFSYIENKKGWYEVSDKIKSCGTLEELKPIEDDIKNKAESRMNEVLSTSKLQVAYKEVLYLVPKYYQRFYTFYDDNFKVKLNEVTRIMSNDEAISSIGFDYVDMALRKIQISNKNIEYEKQTNEKGEELTRDEIERKLAFGEWYKLLNDFILQTAISERGWEEQLREAEVIGLCKNCVKVIGDFLSVHPTVNRHQKISNDMTKSQRKQLAKKLQEHNMWNDDLSL